MESSGACELRLSCPSWMTAWRARRNMSIAIWRRKSIDFCAKIFPVLPGFPSYDSSECYREISRRSARLDRIRGYRAGRPPLDRTNRKSVVKGESVSVSEVVGGWRIIKQKKN